MNATQSKQAQLDRLLDEFRALTVPELEQHIDDTANRLHVLKVLRTAKLVKEPKEPQRPKRLTQRLQAQAAADDEQQRRNLLAFLEFSGPTTTEAISRNAQLDHATVKRLLADCDQVQFLPEGRWMLRRPAQA